MRTLTRLVFPIVSLALLLGACGSVGGGSGLVVIPPKMENAKADTAEYKDVHAVYIYDIGYVTFDPMEIGNSQYPSYVFSEFARVKLLTRAATEGYRFGNYRFRHLGELKNIEAYVEKPDGTRKKLQESDYIHNVVIKNIIPGATPAIHLYETTIVFPGLEAGDIIGYAYTRLGRDSSWTFSKQDAPVKYSKFMIARPMRRIEIQPLIYDRHGLNPQKSEEKGIATGMTGRVGNRQATYDIWTATDVPAIQGEPSLQPLVDIASRIRVWQGDRRWEWSVLGDSYYRWFTHYGRQPAKAKELAATVIKGIEEPRERARAIHDWVKKNLNIQDNDQLSWAPRELEITTLDIDELLENKSATPEQAANLMWLMMSSSGVDASLVLATSKFDAPAEEGLPDLYQFTYPLLGLPDGTVIDTTSRFAAFGQVPWWFHGRKSLWIKGSTVAFKKLASTASADNMAKSTVKGSLSTEGEAKVEVRQVRSGQLGFDLRRYLGPMPPKEREKWLQSVVSNAAEKGELGEFSFNNLDDATKDLELVYSFKVPSYAQVLRDKQVVKLGAFVDLTRCPELVAENRLLPVWFAFPWREEMEIQIELPLGFSLQALPKGFRTRQYEQGTAVGVQTSYGSPDGKNMHVIRKLSFNETFIGKKGYALMRKMIQRYLAAKDTLVTLELPKMD